MGIVGGVGAIVGGVGAIVGGGRRGGDKKSQTDVWGLSGG